ncbi:hypothetical protein hmeg3_02100 [Herbaspirillum sp. meg3]|nr:hypothetical protein hmeg3_02100 [Herbaspirillum sp. meg3]
MNSDLLPSWLRALGYDAGGKSVHHRGDAVDPTHPYSVELNDLLSPDGQIQAAAVFDVQGSPTVAFFDDEGPVLEDAERFDRIRQRIWNQNLISILMVVSENGLLVYPLGRKHKPALLKPGQASPYSFFSAADIHSGEIQQRFPQWFKPDSRVDRQLLRNLQDSVRLLVADKHPREIAQTLLGQVLFISYLEHRHIISDNYRKQRRVGQLHELIATGDIKGIKKLIQSLRKDFNGDFLSLDPDNGELWDRVNAQAFPILDSFLARVDVSSGQRDFWNYDFSFIPVELLSGIYESFIDDKQKMGAFYTPRPLANLVIEQAFSTSEDPLEEYIYDGACGSGILLTTAFRRLIGLAESRQGRQLMLSERIELLQQRIFGSDLNKSACKVTAFSLYLSLLEDLVPSDVLALQENESVKLPTLQDNNLFSGLEKGDFFSCANPLANNKRFTLLLSNPPWREPDKDERTSADEWAYGATGVTRSRRQMAGDFAFRAADCLVDGGRMCLIMPASLFLAPTSQEFVSGWIVKNHITQIINFGDLMNFVFEDAEHSCVVVCATPRAQPTQGIPVDEVIDYSAPKADTSLAFGRLTLASGDRHFVSAQAYFADCSRLVTLMWGNEADLALLHRLQWNGTFREMVAGPEHRWVRRKGFHKEDASVIKPVSSAPLRKSKYVEIGALKRGLPIVLSDDLTAFPSSIKEVAKLSDSLMSAFAGPRILFPDGFDRELEIRASYLDVPASFSSSIGVIAGPEKDADLLQFTAVYLRSDLAKYFLLMSAYQVVCDRNRVTLLNIDDFPFVTPEGHSAPEKARSILRKVSVMVSKIDGETLAQPQNHYADIRDQLNEFVFDYFELTVTERELVREAVAQLVPSVRPRGYASLNTQIQSRVESTHLHAYAKTLEDELNEWQRELSGQGTVSVNVLAMDYRHVGPLGVVHVSLEKPQDGNTVTQSDAAVEYVLRGLVNQGIFPQRLSEDLYFAPDTIIWSDTSLYLVRPLIRRFWLRRTAIKDARQIVQAVHKKARQEEPA